MRAGGQDTALRSLCDAQRPRSPPASVQCSATTRPACSPRTAESPPPYWMLPTKGRNPDVDERCDGYSRFRLRDHSRVQFSTVLRCADLLDDRVQHGFIVIAAL